MFLFLHIIWTGVTDHWRGRIFLAYLQVNIYNSYRAHRKNIKTGDWVTGCRIFFNNHVGACRFSPWFTVGPGICPSWNPLIFQCFGRTQSVMYYTLENSDGTQHWGFGSDDVFSLSIRVIFRFHVNFQDQNCVCLLHIWDEILRSYMGVIISHCKDPYESTSISWFMSTQGETTLPLFQIRTKPVSARLRFIGVKITVCHGLYPQLLMTNSAVWTTSDDLKQRVPDSESSIYHC